MTRIKAYNIAEILAGGFRPTLPGSGGLLPGGSFCQGALVRGRGLCSFPPMIYVSVYLEDELCSRSYRGSKSEQYKKAVRDSHSLYSV